MDTNMGLPKRATDYLTEHRAMPGEPCWCCGLPLPDDPPVIKVVAGIQLRRYVLKTPGMVAEEEVQATVDDKHYLRLRVRPDGVLAHGDGTRIEWPVDAWLRLFEEGSR